jgi:hypothetical protein
MFSGCGSITKLTIVLNNVKQVIQMLANVGRHACVLQNIIVNYLHKDTYANKLYMNYCVCWHIIDRHCSSMCSKMSTHYTRVCLVGGLDHF